jgi:hypothetical protein
MSSSLVWSLIVCYRSKNSGCLENPNKKPRTEIQKTKLGNLNKKRKEIFD